MKKFLIVLLSITLLLTVAGCGSDEAAEPAEEVEVEEVAAEEEVKEGEDIPIHPDDLKAEIVLLEPDSIGNVYAEATFENNSEYPIIGYNLTILKKDTNETSYLMTYDTVMPGETSPTFQGSGPDTQKDEDYEKVRLEVVAQLENGNELHIDYDFKLGTAEWAEYE